MLLLHLRDSVKYALYNYYNKIDLNKYSIQILWYVAVCFIAL